MNETLFDMIKFWTVVKIDKKLSEDEKLARDIIKDRLNSTDEVVFISFQGGNGPLFARSYVVALNNKCEIVDSYCTRIS